MQLWVAALLFFLSVVCIVLCAVIAAACAVYIVLTAIMLYAASTK